MYKERRCFFLQLTKVCFLLQVESSTVQLRAEYKLLNNLHYGQSLCSAYADAHVWDVTVIPSCQQKENKHVTAIGFKL
jgi:hypothetical protein